MKTTPLLTLALLTQLLCAATAGATMRCDSAKLVKIGDSSNDVYLKCGRPHSRRIMGNIRRNKLFFSVEKWAYKPGRGRLLKILEFHDGILREISHGERIQ